MDVNDSMLDMCRLCLDTAECLLPLFSKIKNVFLTEMIKVTIDITVSSTDNLPRKICSTCLTKIDYTYNIREEFKLSERKLKNILNSGSLTNYYLKCGKYDQKVVKKETYADSIMRESKELLLPKQSPMQYTEIAQVVTSSEIIIEDTSIDYILEEPSEVITLDDDDSSKVEILDFVEETEIPAPKRRQRKTLIKNEIENTKEFLPPRMPPHFCYVCNTDSETAEMSEEHMATHFYMLPYTCESCSTEDLPSKIMKTLCALNKHFQMHTNPIKCRYCETRFTSTSGRVHHEKRYHRANYAKKQCPICKKSYAAEKYLRNHMKMHNGVSKFKCETCNKLFMNKATLLRHERIHSGDKPFVCHICGRPFNHETNFQDHKKRHLGVEGFKCIYCPYEFTCREDLHEHTKCHFNKEKIAKINPKMYKCNVCDYVSSTYGAIYSHRTKHNKIHQCAYCGKKFGKFKTMQDHENTHTGLKPYKCVTCDKSFAQSASFYIHLRIHTGVKKYKCGFCDKRFCQSQNCKAHIRLHTGEMPFSCEFCSKKFAEKNSMNRHIKAHHKKLLEDEAVIKPEADASIVCFEEGYEDYEVIKDDDEEI